MATNEGLTSTIATTTLVLGGRPVSLRRAGAADGPALVLLHGLPTSSFLWRRCLPGLATALPGWRIVAPDLPGYGRSAPWPGAGPRALGRFLDALLRELGVGRFALAGHDLGGLVALTDAVVRVGKLPGTPSPEREGGPRLERLILLDTTIYPTPPLVLGLLPSLVPPFPEIALAWLRRAGAGTRRRRYLEGLRGLLAPGTELTPEEEVEYAAPYEGIAGWREATRSIRALAGQAGFVLRCTAHLRDLALPTRLIWGERDPFFPPATAERLRRVIPGAEGRVHLIAGAGHFPQEDRPSEVTRLIAEFLA
ncbi:MAG: alpha/beta hydrolase [Chloroflexota bacterium]|nr:alpha/beta hydrolase [Chloroflexota bacterium]